MPKTASQIGSAAAVITSAKPRGNTVQKITSEKMSHMWFASQTGVIDWSISVRGASTALVAAREKVPQPAAKVRPAKERVEADAQEQDRAHEDDH